MENKNRTVIDSIDQTNTNVTDAKNEIIDVIRDQNRNNNFKGGYNWTNLFSTCTTVAIDRTQASTFKKRIFKTNIFLIIQMALSLFTFIFSSIYLKKASMSGIFIALAAVPFIVLFIKNLKMKPALLTYRLVQYSPVFYKTYQGNVIRVTNRCSAAIIWFDIFVCLSTFCDCGEISLVTNLDIDKDLYIFLTMFALFVVQCVLSGIFANRIKNYFQYYCVYYIKGYVQNNGVQPIEAIIDPTDAQIIFSIDEYNSKYPYFIDTAKYVNEELSLFTIKKNKK